MCRLALNAVATETGNPLPRFPRAKTKTIWAIAIMAMAHTLLYAQSDGDFEIQQNPDNTITITGYKGSVKNIVIPSTLYGLKVTRIGKNAFRCKGLTNVVLPNTLVVIEESAFCNEPSHITGYGELNKFTTITIPNSVTDIGDKAFLLGYSGDNRRAVVIGELTKVSLGNSVRTIGRDAFSYNKLNDVALPPSVVSIGDGAFRRNEIEKLRFGAGIGIKEIEAMVFFGNKLTELTLPASVKTIHSLAFASNKLVSVIIPNGVTIGSKAFAENQLTFVTIPDNVTILDADNYTNVFGDNPTLTCITMPANLGDDVLSYTGFEEGFINFYKNQNRAANSYLKNGPIWTISASPCAVVIGEKVKAAQTAEAERAKAAQAEQARAKNEGRGVLVDGKLKDSRDDKTYTVAKIGNQTWMSENLNYDIPGVTADECYEGKANNCDKYGRLYRWDEANKACPVGWRLPSETDWTTFENYLSGGNKKDAWKIVAERLIPGEYGSWSHSGRYAQMGSNDGWWWSSTEVDAKGVAKNAWSRSIFHSQESGTQMWNKDKQNKQNLRSVRCIRE